MQSKNWNNTNFSIPENKEPKRTWGRPLAAFLSALADNALARYGGSFPISGADVDWGNSFGHVAKYFKSRSSNIADAGILRLAKGDTINFRNEANSGNLALGRNSSDLLTFNGAVIGLGSDITGLNGRLTTAEGTIATHTGQISTLSTTVSGLDSDIDSLDARLDLTEASILTHSGQISTLTTDLAGKQALDSDLTAIAALSTNGLAKKTGAGSWAITSARDEVGLTTKGDILGDTGSALGRLPVGANGTVLTADSAETLGLKWTAPLVNPMDAAGQLIYGGASGAVTKLPAGAAGAILRSGGAAIPVWDAAFSIDPTTGVFTSDTGSAAHENRIKGSTRIGSSANSAAPNSTNYRQIGNQKGYLAFTDASSTLLLERGCGIYTADLSTYTRQTSGAGGSIERMKPSAAATDAIWEMLTTAIAGTGVTLSQVAAVLQNGLFKTAAGIQFPATQVASSGANDLDDYEEGTFTPAFGSSGGSPSFSYTFRDAAYVKIGSMVYFYISVLVNVVSNAGSGTCRITGLPFTAASTPTVGQNVGLNYAADFSASMNPFAGYVVQNTTYIELTYRTASAGPLAGLATSAYANSCNVQMAGCYKAS